MARTHPKERELKSEIDESIVDSATRGIGGAKYGWLQQYCENGDDADASVIRIVFLEDQVLIIDNGTGMTDIDRDFIVSLGKSGSRGKKGRKGTFGTGGKVYRGVSNRCAFATVHSKEPNVIWSASFTRDEQTSALFGGPKIKDTPRPWDADFPLAKGQSGTVIIISEFDSDKMPSYDEVLKHLADELDPRVAAKVRLARAIAGEDEPLPQREITGEVIEDEVQVEGLGRIYYSLYIPVRKARGDRLRIGANGPVCDLQDVLGNLPEDIRRRVPDAILYPYLFGIIDVEAFGDYPTSGRRAFDIKLFTEKQGVRILNTFVDWLTFELAEEIEKRIGVLNKSDDAELREKVMAVIEDLCTSAFGPAEPGLGAGGKKPQLQTNVRRVTLETGETIVFRVTDIGSTSGQFRWDPSQAGGTIDSLIGDEVTYTAGDKPGGYTLCVFDEKNSLIKVEISITIVEEHDFALSPASATLLPGETITIRAKRVEKTSGDLRWIASGSGGKLTQRNPTEAVFRAGKTLGTYTLRVVDRKDHSIEAACEIKIVTEKKQPKKKEQEDEFEYRFRIRDQVYTISFKLMTGSPVASYIGPADASAPPTARRVVTIHVNIGHPAAMRAKTDSLSAYRDFVLGEAILRHVVLTQPEASPMAVADMLGEIKAELFKNN